MNYNQNFGKFEKRAGSSFGAVLAIAKEARQRVLACENKISESDAIAWIVDGEIPKTLRSTRSHKISYMRELLSNVYDPRIIDCVIKSIKLTKEKTKILNQEHKKSTNNLIESTNYLYYLDDSLNNFEKSKVRILTKMILDHKD